MKKLQSCAGKADMFVERSRNKSIDKKSVLCYSESTNACERALAQIREKRYDERLRNEGRNNILAYGVAFCKKRCKVAVQRL